MSRRRQPRRRDCCRRRRPESRPRRRAPRQHGRGLPPPPVLGAWGLASSEPTRLSATRLVLETTPTTSIPWTTCVTMPPRSTCACHSSRYAPSREATSAFVSRTTTDNGSVGDAGAVDAASAGIDGRRVCRARLLAPRRHATTPDQCLSRFRAPPAARTATLPRSSPTTRLLLPCASRVEGVLSCLGRLASKE